MAGVPLLDYFAISCDPPVKIRHDEMNVLYSNVHKHNIGAIAKLKAVQELIELWEKDYIDECRIYQTK